MKHLFDVEVAERYGVHAAILLENLNYWIAKNRASRQNFHEGRYWTYNSNEAFAELFPYLTPRQINYALQKLKDEGIIITGNFNALAYDRTLWYAITEKGESILQNRETHFTNLSNGNPEIVEPIPDINADVNADGKPDMDISPSANAPAKPTRHKYGEYKNVLLSDEDMEKLKSEFPSDWEQRIERLSEYIAQTGRKYKNHLATIRAWSRKEGGRNGANNSRANAVSVGDGDSRFGTWF